MIRSFKINVDVDWYKWIVCMSTMEHYYICKHLHTRIDGFNVDSRWQQHEDIKF